MNKKTLIFLIISITILIVAICIFMFAKAKSTENINNIGNSNINAQDTEPAFYFYDKEENKLSLNNFNNKPCIIILWNSTSIDSLDVLQTIDNYYDSYKDLINFVTINTNEESTRISSLLETINFSMPIYFDKDLTASREYTFDMLPYTIFIDKNGNINKTIEGNISEDSLTANLDLISENY